MSTQDGDSPHRSLTSLLSFSHRPPQCGGNGCREKITVRVRNEETPYEGRDRGSPKSRLLRRMTRSVEDNQRELGRVLETFVREES